MHKQKNIAFITRYFDVAGEFGGAEKFCNCLVNGFMSRNYNVDIYCNYTNAINHSCKIVKIKADYNPKYPETLELFFNEAKNKMENNQYDYIFTENITPFIDIGIIHCHTQLYRQNNGILQQFLYSLRPNKQKRIKYEKKWLSLPFRKLFVVSNMLKDDLIKNYGVDPERIRVIYPGIYIDEYMDAVDNNTSNLQLNIGFCGIAFEKKGGYILLNAIRILKDKGYNFKVRIIYPRSSKNIYLQNLIRFYNLKNYIEFLPIQNNMRDFYNTIDILVMPSKEETFGMVALEAIIAKKTVLVSSNCGIAEILNNYAKQFVFENNPCELAKRIEYIFNNIEKLATAKDEVYKIASLYTWEKTFNDLTKFLN